MKKFCIVSALLLSVLFIATGCGGKTSGTTGGATNGTTGGSTGTATSDITKSTAFKYYNAVNIGMTKAQVESATGLTGVLDTTGYALDNTYYYKDAAGKYGVCIVFNKDMKVYSKTVVYPDPAEALAPVYGKTRNFRSRG